MSDSGAADAVSVAPELARGALHVPLSRVSKKMRLRQESTDSSSRHIFRDCTCARREAFPSSPSTINKNHNMATKGKAMKGNAMKGIPLGLEQSDGVYAHLRPRTGQVLPHVR